MNACRLLRMRKKCPYSRSNQHVPSYAGLICWEIPASSPSILEAPPTMTVWALAHLQGTLVSVSSPLLLIPCKRVNIFAIAIVCS